MNNIKDVAILFKTQNSEKKKVTEKNYKAVAAELSDFINGHYIEICDGFDYVVVDEKEEKCIKNGKEVIRKRKILSDDQRPVFSKLIGVDCIIHPEHNVPELLESDVPAVLIRDKMNTRNQVIYMGDEYQIGNGELLIYHNDPYFNCKAYFRYADEPESKDMNNMIYHAVLNELQNDYNMLFVEAETYWDHENSYLILSAMEQVYNKVVDFVKNAINNGKNDVITASLSFCGVQFAHQTLHVSVDCRKLKDISSYGSGVKFSVEGVQKPVESLYSALYHMLRHHFE